MRPSDHLFPGGSAWLEHKFLEVLGSTYWRRCRWHSLRMGGSAVCYARHPQLQLFLWWACWRSVGTTLRYATAFQDAAVVGPLPLPAEPGSGGGGGGQPGFLPTWRFRAPHMFPSEAEPLPTVAFHPPAWPEDLLPPPPPRCTPSRRGGEIVRKTSSRQILLGSSHPCCSPPDPPQRTQGSGRSLRYSRLQ